MIERRIADRIPGSEMNPAAWMSACFEPWAMLEEWSRFWAQQWQHWFDALASMPGPFIPGLPANRPGEPLAFDFFLPWLPRIEAFVTPLESDKDRDAMRVRLRAAISNAVTGERAEWLNVDATVSRSTTSAPLPVEEASAPELAAPSEQVIDLPAEQLAQAPTAPKPRARRTRAPGKPRTNEPGTGA